MERVVVLMRRILRVLAVCGVPLILLGCTAPSPPPAPQSSLAPRSQSATGIGEGLRLTVTVDLPVRAASVTTIAIEAFNSTEETLTAGAIHRFEVTDASGEIVDGTDSRKFAIMSVPVPPGTAYSTTVAFTLPSPGEYLFSMPEAVMQDGIPLTLDLQAVGRGDGG